MLNVALFTIAKIQNQLRCSSADEWLEKMRYIYKMVFCANREERHYLIFWQMGKTGHYYIKKLNQTQKDKQFIFLSLMDP